MVSNLKGKGKAELQETEDNSLLNANILGLYTSSTTERNSSVVD